LLPQDFSLVVTSTSARHAQHCRAYVIVDQVALGRDRFVRAAHRQLFRQHQHAEIAQQVAQVKQRAQAAERARGGADDGHRLLRQDVQAGDPAGRGKNPRNPVQGIDQQRRHRAVIFGGGDQQGIVLVDQHQQAGDHFGDALLGFEVAVIQRRVVIVQVDQRGLRACLQQCDARGVGDALGQRGLARAAGENQNTGKRHGRGQLVMA